MTFPQFGNFKGGSSSGSKKDKSKKSFHTTLISENSTPKNQLAPDYSGIALEIAIKHNSYFEKALLLTAQNFNKNKDEIILQQLSEDLEKDKALSLSNKPLNKKNK